MTIRSVTEKAPLARLERSHREDGPPAPHSRATEVGTKGKRVGKEGKGRSVLAPTASGVCQLPRGPVWPGDHGEKERSSPSRKIHKVNKPVPRTARRQENGQTRIQTPGTRAYTLGPGRSRMAPLGRPASSTRPTQDCLEGLRHICFGEYTFEEINLLHSLTA